MRRVIIATLITTAALGIPSATATAAPRVRTATAAGSGSVMTVGGGLEDFGALRLTAPMRRSATTDWTYDATTAFAAGTGCTTSVGTCYATTGTLTLSDGNSSLLATVTGTDDATAVFTWTAEVTGGTGAWRRARGTIRVSGNRDWVDDQRTVSTWDLTDLNL